MDIPCEEPWYGLSPDKPRTPWCKDATRRNEYKKPMKLLCQINQFGQTPPKEISLIDGIKDRPRTPNTQYSVLTKEQINNIRQKPEEFFYHKNTHNDVTCDKKPCYKERHVHLTSGHVLRGLDLPGHPHLCWVGDQIRRVDVEKAYNSSKGMAAVKWGLQKMGERTRGHFFGENTERFTEIDMYRRPATCYAGRVVMDYGRPADGYYTQRFPDRTTWCGSVIPQNNRPVLQSVYNKTWADYHKVKVTEQLARANRSADWLEWEESADVELSDWMDEINGPVEAWPEFSVYTNDYLLRVPYRHKSGLTSAKRQARIGQRLQHQQLQRDAAAALAAASEAAAAKQAAELRTPGANLIVVATKATREPADSYPTILATAAKSSTAADNAKPTAECLAAEAAKQCNQKS